MSKVIAVFDDGSRTEEASKQLTSAGYGEDIHVVSSAGKEVSSAGAATAVVDPSGGNATQGAVAVSVRTHDDLNHLDLGEEEAAFYKDQLNDGAELVIVETDNTGAVTELFEKLGANRVDTIN